MFFMRFETETYWNPAGIAEMDRDGGLHGLRELAMAITARQLQDLMAMRAVGMASVRQLERRMHGRLGPEEEKVFARRSGGIINDFVKVARAVRQIIVLEQELMGLRPSRRGKAVAIAKLPALPSLPRSKGLPSIFPTVLRDDTGDYYDTRPVGEAVGWIRETLGIEAPATDPFGAPKPRAPARAETPVAEPQAAEETPVSTKRCVVAHAYDIDLRDEPDAELELAGAGDGRRPGLRSRGPP